MMILQSRLLAQVNCGGWTDLKDPDNVAGTNTESTLWLDDAKWHYYTATYTETSVKIYVDGVIKNEWNCTAVDEHKVSGLFSNGSELDYICLGGNQAWGWNDADASYLFDDVAIYSSALTAAQISAIMTAKTTITSIKPVAQDNGEVVAEEYYSVGGEKVGNSFNQLQPGVYIKKSAYGNGVVKISKFAKAY